MFRFKTYLPGRKEDVYSRQLTSDEYVDVIKTVSNDDTPEIRRIFATIYNMCSVSDIKFEDLHTIDIFCLLLNIRIMSVSDTLSLSYEVNKASKNLKIDLYEILDQSTNADIIHSHIIELSEDVRIELSTPRNLKKYDLNDSFSIIHSIHANDDITYYTDLTPEQKSSLVSSLPVKHVTSIHEMLTKFNNLNVPVVPETITEQDGVSMQLNVADNSIYELLRLCYAGNMMEIYQIRYLLSKRCNMDTQYLGQRPPIDVETYLGMYKEELAAEKKAADKGRGRDVNMPMKEFVQ